MLSSVLVIRAKNDRATQTRNWLDVTARSSLAPAANVIQIAGGTSVSHTVDVAANRSDLPLTSLIFRTLGYGSTFFVGFIRADSEADDERSFGPALGI